MKTQDRLQLIVRLLLVVVAAVLLRLQPLPVGLRQAWGEAQQGSLEGLQTALAWQPWRGDLWESLGQELGTQGQAEEAAAALEEAHRLGALSAEGQVRLGDLYAELGQAERAESWWFALLKQDSPPEAAFLRAAQVLRAGQRWAELEDTLRSGLRVHPNSAELSWQLGALLAASLDSGAEGYLRSAAQAEATAAQAEAVRQALLTAAASGGTEAYQLVGVGRALAGQGQWDLAELAFDQAVAADPTYAEAWAFRGEARYQTGADGGADVRQALKLNPQSVLAQALQALQYRRAGEGERALEILRRVAAQEPQEPAWQLEMGYAFIEMGDSAAALPYFQKAVTLAPDRAALWRELAQFCIQYDADARALGLPAARQAVLLAPQDARSQDVMGWVLMNLGDYASAERFLQQALSLEDRSAQIHLHLGQLYLQMEDMERAFPHLTRARSLGKGTETEILARRLLERFFDGG